jgi:hypothetical protein
MSLMEAISRFLNEPNLGKKSVLLKNYADFVSLFDECEKFVRSVDNHKSLHLNPIIHLIQVFEIYFPVPR